MNQLNVVMCGCVRNNEGNINDTLNALYKSKTLFNNFKMVIYENDSQDKTLDVINNFKNNTDNEDIHIISEKIPISCYTNNNYFNTYHIRPINISNGRNKLIEYIETHYSNYDIMIMIDLDDVSCTFDYTKLELLFKHLDSFDAITANSMGKYMMYGR